MNRATKLILEYLIRKYGAEQLARIIITDYTENLHISKNPRKRINPEAIEGRLEV